ASGLGLVLCSGALGRLMVPIMDLHDNRGSFLFHVVLASLAVLALLALMLLPESKRKRLPDDLRQGDRYRRPPLFTATSFTFAGDDRGEAGGGGGGRRRRGDVPLLSGAGGGGGFAFLPADDDDGADDDGDVGDDDGDGAEDGAGPAEMRGGDRRLALEGHVVEAVGTTLPEPVAATPVLLLPPPPPPASMAVAPPGRSHGAGITGGGAGGRRPFITGTARFGSARLLQWKKKPGLAWPGCGGGGKNVVSVGLPSRPLSDQNFPLLLL
ncbi:unnamed protein product, partial [Lampetra fluviatilis]